MTNDETARFFNETRAFIQGNPDLQNPHVEGRFRTRQHLRNSSGHAIRARSQSMLFDVEVDRMLTVIRE